MHRHDPEPPIIEHARRLLSISEHARSTVCVHLSPPPIITDPAGFSLKSDEFLSQILDAPAVSPTTAPTSTQISTPATEPAPPPVVASLPEPNPVPILTCHWVPQHDPTHICGAPLPHDPKQACTHFRLAHNIRGNDKVTVNCQWYGCRAAPMQRGSLIRHVSAVHLGILRWQCATCGRMFSRRGTGHLCGGGAGA